MGTRSYYPPEPPDFDRLNPHSYEIYRQSCDKPQELREFPLILIPQNWFDLSEVVREQQPKVQQALQQWQVAVEFEDQCLRIDRPAIPRHIIWLPDTFLGKSFQHIAQGIGKIPTGQSLQFQNQHQGAALRTLQMGWQVRGIFFANALFSLPVSILNLEKVLEDLLPTTLMERCRLNQQLDQALWRILTSGWEHFQTWWSQNRSTPWPYDSPQNLFLSILQADFVTAWDNGPGQATKQEVQSQWIRSDAYETAHRCQAKYFRELWFDDVDPSNQRQSHGFQRWVDSWHSLETHNWWIVAARDPAGWADSRPKALQIALQTYIQAFTHALTLAVPPVQWPYGRPQQNQHTSKTHLIHSYCNLFGFCLWDWGEFPKY